MIVGLKHYNLYTQETTRANAQNAIADERTIQEIFTPPFEAGVRAGMANAMCSFNKLNGVYACENNDLLQRILRTQLGFDGFVITDYGASHSTVGSINAGLNIEAGFTTFYDGALLDAVRAGQVSVTLVDQRVREILRAMFRVGLFDHPLPSTRQPIPVEEHGGIARETENQAVTLLKNANAALPVARPDVKSIAVIGADANRLAQQSGAPAVGTPTYRMPLLEGVRQRAGSDASVDWAPGGDGVGPSSMLPGPPAVPSAVLSLPARPAGSGCARSTSTTSACRARRSRSAR